MIDIIVKIIIIIIIIIIITVIHLINVITSNYYLHQKVGWKYFDHICPCISLVCVQPCSKVMGHDSFSIVLDDAPI